MSEKEYKATILLLRHGQIPQSHPRRFVGQRDLPLDSEGERQADLVASWLRLVLPGLPPFEGIVHSPLARTTKTASILAEAVDAQLEPEPALREISLGKWEGLSKVEVEARFPGALQKRGDDMAGVAPEGGESFRDVQKRVMPAIEDIAARTNGTRIVVAHGGVNRAILCTLLGMPLANIFRLGQDYCCCNALVKGQDGLEVQAVNLLPWSPGGLVSLSLIKT